MSEYIKTSVTLLKTDKQFIDSNFISLSKLIRQTINDKRKRLSTQRQPGGKSS